MAGKGRKALTARFNLLSGNQVKNFEEFTIIGDLYKPIWYILE
jgi:hypothetical protein